MTFSFHKAKTQAEAIALKGAYPDLPVLAGGTDLLVQWRMGTIEFEGVVDISRVEELKRIESVKKTIVIGACTTHGQIVADKNVNRFFPGLVEAARTVGFAQVQNRGTIGGNIMNASPAADVPTALMVYDTRFLLQDVKGERWVPACDFYTGYKRTALKKSELLTKIEILKPRDQDETAVFYKIIPRRAHAISKVSMCVRASVSHGAVHWISIGVGSMAPTVVRAYGTEALLKGKVITESLIEQARRSMHDEFHPIDDIRSTADYRRFVCGNLIAKFLRESVAKKG